MPSRIAFVCTDAASDPAPGSVRAKEMIVEFLPQDLAEFSRAHPGVKFDLQERISPAIVRAVLDNETDIGIFGGNVFSAGLVTHDYRKDHLAVVVPLGHALENSSRLRFSDLIYEDWVGMRDGSSIDSLCATEAARLNMSFHPKVRVAGLDAVLRMVEAALGISIIPREMASDVLHANRVRLIELDEPWAIRTLVVGVRSMHQLTEGSRLLVEHLIGSAHRAMQA